MRRTPPALVAFALALAASSARAQGNDRSAPMGGRSALMGNTGVALAEDGAAPFVNPSTIVRINDQAIALAVNFFTFSDTHFDNWHQPAGANTSTFGNLALSNTSIDTNGFNPLPSTFCLFFTVAGVTSEGEATGALHKGRQKLAACIGVLEANYVNVGALSFNGAAPGGTTAQVQSFSANWNRLYIGPTYSVSLSDDFAIGISAHAVATNDWFDIEGSSVTSTATNGSVQSSLGTAGSGHAVDFAAVLGAIYRIDKVTLGASFQTPSLHLFGSFNGGLHNEYSNASVQSAVVTSGSGGFQAPPPVRASLGVGVQLPRLSLELDGSYDFAISNALQTTLTQMTSTTTGGAVTTTPSTATYIVPGSAVAGVAAGYEYFVTPAFSLVGGAGINLSTLSPLAPVMTPGNLVVTQNNYANASFGIGSYGNGGNVLLGIQLGYGWGQALGVNDYSVPNSWAIVDTHQYSATLILAGATNLRTITRAVEEVKSVVTGKPP